MKLIHGDCLEKLKELPDNSVDSVVTDPPYGLSFMGKKWDYDVPSEEIWKECLRVLKPGGHLLSFAGTRTQHRMACNIEDAGFEIRDMIMYIYGSGFPKSLNIGKSVNQLETNEWSKISKALDNIENKSIMEVWKSNSNNVKIVETQSLKNQTIAGQDMPSENFVVLNVVQNSSQENSNLIVSFAERNLNEAPAINTKTNTALLSVETEIRQLQNNVKSAEQQSQNQSHKSWSIFTAQCDVKEWLKENTMVSLKVDEVLKTLRGNKKYSNEEIINVLNAVIPSVLKHTILNQSKTFQNLDTNQKMECVSVINVIITEYIMDNLISNTVAILKSKAVDKLQGNEREYVGIKQYAGPSGDNRNFGVGNDDESNTKRINTKGTSEWEGWGTALKPAMEPITVARKPFKGTVSENCLKHGTGGINIDGCRVGTETIRSSGEVSNAWREAEGRQDRQVPKPTVNVGRWPANLIHDGSEEVVGLFPNGNSRFFYCCKASKRERNEGCEELDFIRHSDREKDNGIGGANPRNRTNTAKQNFHPTVKPLALMRYLVRLVTRKGGVVLDPFMGSGTTGVACREEGMEFIGIEREEEYIKIAEARIQEHGLFDASPRN